MHLNIRPKGPLGLIDKLHAFQNILAKAYGQPTDAMLTDLTKDDKPVIFLHSPKTAGKSLRQFLRVARLSHSFASERLSTKSWLNTFSIVAVRDPFERFLSGYYYHVLKQSNNGLVRLYGPEFKSISAFSYLEVLKKLPKFGGPQQQWTNYPSSVKPCADLVLRFEQIGIWKEQMIAAGLAVTDRDFPHNNRSKRAESDHLRALNLSQSEFDQLEAKVREHFATDYVAFGYP